MKYNHLRHFALLFLLLGSSSTGFAQSSPVLTIQLSHSVRGLAVTPDGQYLVSGGDNTVKIWDLTEQRLLRTFQAHDDKVMAVAISPDGKLIATASIDKTLRLWDFTGKPIRTFTGHTGSVYAVSFSKDGRRLLSGSSDGSAKLWDVTGGQAIRTFTGTRGGVFAAAISPDGATVLTGGQDGLVRLYDLNSGAEKRALRGHFESVISVAWAADGQRFASGGTDQIVRIWSTAGDTPQRSMDGHKHTIQAVAFSPDGAQLASSGGEQDGEVFLWDAASGEQIGNLRGHEYIVYGLAFDPAGETLFSGGFDATIRAWAVESPAQLYTLQGVAEPVYDLTYSRGGKYLAALNNGRIVVRDALSGKPFAKIEVEARKLAFSPNGLYIATAGFDGNVDVYETVTGTRIAQFQNHDGPVTSVSFGTNSNLLYSAGSDGTVRNYSIKDKKQLRTFPTAEGVPMLAIAVNPAGGFVAGVDAQGTLTVWSNKTAEVLIQANDHKGPALSVTYSRDGALLATGGKDGKVNVYDVKTGQKKYTLSGHTEGVTTLSFKPDASALASGCGELAGFRDRTIRIWNMASGAQSKLIDGHQGRVYALSYSADGRILASGSEDCQLKLWETSGYGELLSVAAYAASRDYVITSPSGHFYGSDHALKSGIYYVQNDEFFSLDGLFDKFFAPQLWSARVSGQPLFQSKPVLVEQVSPEIKPDPTPDPEPTTTEDPTVTTPLVTAPVVAPPPAAEPIQGGFKPLATVAILNPQNGQLYEGKDEIKVTVEATDMGSGIDEIRLYLNGKIVIPEERGIQATVMRMGTKTQKIFPIKLLPGLNELKAVAFNADRTESKPSTIYVQLSGPDPKASLFVLVIGINAYKNEQYNLNYGKPDAEALAAAMKVSGEGVFDKVVVTELYDAQATSANVETALNDFIVRAKAQDVFVFFYAGHGVMGYRTPEEGDFFLVLHNVVKMFGNDQLLNAEGFSATRLKELAAKLPAQKQLLLMDACQSGGAVTTFSSRGAAEEKAIAQLGRSTGMVVLAATASDQFAYEFGALGHGAFTYSILEGLKGLADGGRQDGAITVTELKAFVEDLVPEMTQKIKGKAQYPNSYASGQDFPIGTVKK